MELKNYQELVLERFSTYLSILKEKQQNALDLAQMRQKKNLPVLWGSEDFNFCKRAWDELTKQKLIPPISTKQVSFIPSYKDRYNGIGHPVPNVCLKVPTGGGKTLLGSNGVERINTAFLERNTGFVLWVVPSDSIYTQTLKTLNDRESLNRQILDRASAGKVKILKWRGKDKQRDKLHFQDVENYLCVLLLMLPTATGQSKDILTMFRSSGKFNSFFPPADAYHEIQKWLSTCPNLDTYDIPKLSLLGGQKTVSLKHSLGNVLKLIQPIVVIDEGHRAYTEKAKSSLMDLNPCFILELSATPNKQSHESNVLVAVSGEQLKKEEMIKLPINIYNLKSKDWKKALSKGYEILQNLSKDTNKLQKKESRYIRPLMLIRVERTGHDQRDKKFIHAEDVREYLIKNFKVDPNEVKVKSATKDELKNEDLLSAYSRVRYIITKEALKEGWDCPFAYILTILSKTKAPVAIEQMIGRVLRQPETKNTSIKALNQSYIVCMDQDTIQAVEGVRKGLQNEGMDGLAGEIKTFVSETKALQPVTIKRRKPFRGLKIFLPKVLHRDGANLKELSYERDLLWNIDWPKLSLQKNLILYQKNSDISHTQVDLIDTKQLISSFQGKSEEQGLEPADIDFGFLCARLSDIIPNSWDTSSAVKKALSFLEKQYGKKQVFSNRFYILDCWRQDLQKQIRQQTEKIFKKKLKNHEIIFKLVSAGDPELNWKMAKTLDLTVSDSSSILRRQDNSDLQLSFFETVYKTEFNFNDLETKVAWYLDENQAIKWWHRIIERQDWSLQGWQKHKIYPDFLVCVKSSQSGQAEFSILETKGQHLMGNADKERWQSG